MEKKPYTRPVIRRQFMGHSNKFGALAIPESLSSIDKVDIEQLVREFGSPLFIFSETTLIRKIQEFKQAFQSRYPSFQPAWSYKTNYLNAICNVFHNEGSWAEVVSAFEYNKARKNGIPGNRIIFNGPFKPYAALKQAAIDGAKIHIDHLDEIQDLLEISKEIKKTIEVAIRINMDTGMYPTWSRFGFNLETGHAMEAARKITFSENRLKLVGLHTHIGTFVTDIAPYKRAAQKIADFYKLVETQLRQPLQYIDLGGGFPSNNKLKAQYFSGSAMLPSFDSYAEAITSTLYEAFSPREPPPLFMECGRALVDEAGYLVTSIVGSKTTPTGKRSYILDAGVNLLYTSTWYDFKISPVKSIPGTYEDVSLVGPLCMNIDVVSDNCLLPNMRRGDHLVVHPVGAYNITQWMQFIEMRPAIVMVSKDGGYRLIRHAESIDDINSKEAS